MAEVDTSSYPRSQPSNFMDVASKLQGLEQQKIGIDTSKLKLVNEQWGIVNKELSVLAQNPNVTPQDAANSMQNLVNLKLVPPEMSAQFLKTIPTQSGAPLQQFFKNELLRGAEKMDAINWHFGPKPEYQFQGAQHIPVQLSNNPNIGVKDLSTGSKNQPLQQQQPPTQREVDTREFLNDGVTPNPNYNREMYRGSQPPEPVPGRSPLPVARPGGVPVNPVLGQSVNFGNVTGVDVQNAPALPVARPGNGSMPNAPSPNQQVQNRYPGGPSGGAAGFAPGVGEAMTATGVASGAQLAKERERASTFQRDVFPLAQAIPALEKLGTKGTGPGTETVNHIKSFLLSNFPGVKETDFGLGTVKDFDKAKKYLTDFVNQTGNSGTNDKLAAAFAGNPSVKISNAAAVDVAKSALALRRMQQAAYLEFENKGLPDHRFSKWFASRVNEIDPRAFGTDMMNNKAKANLLEQLNKNPVEKKRFDDSAELGVKFGFITPR